MLTIISCRKDPPEATLPDEVEFGHSVVFLNGEEVDYLPEFGHDTFNQIMNYPFLQTKNQGNILNLLGFGRLPLRTGDFQLTTENILYIKARTSFSQTVSEDLEGYEYKLVDEDEGFLKIEALDTIKMEVKGRFKAKFKRTSKNGFDDGDLPKFLLFQGVFFDNYVPK